MPTAKSVVSFTKTNGMETASLTISGEFEIKLDAADPPSMEAGMNRFKAVLALLYAPEEAKQITASLISQLDEARNAVAIQPADLVWTSERPLPSFLGTT